MVRGEVHSRQQKLSSPVDGSDGSSVGESPSCEDSSISVNSEERKPLRVRHEKDSHRRRGNASKDSHRRRGNASKADEKKPHDLFGALDEEQTEEQNSNLPFEIQDADVVIIRAKLEQHDFSIKFPLVRPFRFVRLKQEVDKRLLKKGDEKLREDYTIQYNHRDDKLILISCDDEVQLCVKNSRELGKTSRELGRTRVDLLLN